MQLKFKEKKLKLN